jgi:nucleoid-associated protein Lsr2
MAQKVTVQLVDDLDGSASDDISTVTFGLDGVTYEIDLNESNAAKLRKSLDEYRAAARRTGGRVKRGASTPGAATANREQAQAVREWANRNGFDVAARGRIPANVIEAFEAAQSEATSKSRRRKTKASA